jgi:hypothetical protein
LTNNPSAGQLTEIVNTDWPDELCSKSKLVEGSILSPANEGDVIVITGTQNMENKPLIKAIIGRQPHMEKAIMEVAKEGKIVYASNTCSVSTESGTLGEEVQKYTFIAGVDDGECSEEEADQRLVDTLQKLKSICKLRDLKRPSLSVVDLTTESGLRKLVEYVYQDEDVDIAIYTGSRKRATRATEQETEGEQQWKTVSRNREKIVISKKAGDKPVTYAELLRKMQHTVKVHDIDIKIKNVRETKGGDIEITTTGKEEVKDAFIKRIQEKMGEAVTAQKVMAKKKIFIKDIHETATAEDVRKELLKQATEGDKQADNIAVTMAAKPNKGRKLFAFATLPIETANKILKAGKLYVGWNACRVESANAPRRCFRCLRFGHVRENCESEINREDSCLRCCEPGHKARDCKNEPHCAACDQKGPRADDMACPEFKSKWAAKSERGRQGGKMRGLNRRGAC